jgi:23S rRNA (adenine2503-C2)-methyltransferase
MEQDRRVGHKLMLDLGLSFTQTQELLAKQGLNPQFAQLIFQKAYRRPNFKGWNDNRFPLKLRETLEHSNWHRPRPIKLQVAADHTAKFLFQLQDGRTVETVMIPFYRKDTLCLSSQVGCAMGCRFCHTGTQGLTRHLNVAEIVGQYLAAWDWAFDKRPNGIKAPNIVFMGQGEPLHNFTNLKAAIDLMTDPHGLDLSHRRITVSTAGHLPGLERFMQLGGVNLALSLHAAIEDKRRELIPLSRTWPLEKVLKAVDKIPLGRRQVVVYEVMLAANFNDGLEDALALIELMKNRPHMVNLIPFNPYPGSPWQRPTNKSVERFKEILVEHKIRTTIRKTKGDEVMAACGQLKT